MWNPNNSGPPNDNNSDAARRDSDARVAAVAALSAFASNGGFPPPFGFPPPPPPQAVSDRAFSAGFGAPQHPMFMTAAQNHAAFYGQPVPPPVPHSQHYAASNNSSSSPSAASFWGHEYAAGTGLELPRAAASESTPVVPQQPRGKPEAMAARLAALHVESTRQELLEEEEEQQQQREAMDLDYGRAHGDEDDEDDDDEDAVAAECVEENDGGVLANLDRVQVAAATVAATSITKAAPKKKAPAKPKSRPAPKGSSGGAGGLRAMDTRTERLLEEDAPPITNDEYLSLQELMTQFCKVPLLNEFSRPVASLHPEVRMVMVS